MTIQPVTGGRYLFKHSSGIVCVKVLEVYTVQSRAKRSTRYRLLNEHTNRELIAKSARKFLSNF